MASITCTNCGAVLKTKDPVPAGKKVKCPKCTQVFEAPAEEEPADAAEPEEKEDEATGGIQEEPKPKSKGKVAAKNDDDEGEGESDDDGDEDDGAKKGKGKGDDKPKKNNTMLIVIIVIVVVLFCCVCPGICTLLRFFLGVGANLGGAALEDAIKKQQQEAIKKNMDALKERPKDKTN